MTRYANELAEKIRQVPGSADVEVIGIDPEPEIMVRLDQSKASQLGLDNTTVGKVVQYAFQGKSTGNSYTIGNNDYDIIIQMDKDDRRTIQDVANLMVSTEAGGYVRLGDVVYAGILSGATAVSSITPTGFASPFMPLKTPNPAFLKSHTRLISLP